MADETIIMENQERKNRIISVMNGIEHINKKVFPHLDRKDTIRRGIRSTIFDDKKLAKIVPALEVYREIHEIDDRYKNDPFGFINEVKKMTGRIEKTDSELAAKIGPIYFNREVADYLRTRYSELKKIKDVHVFLRELYPTLYSEFGKLENKQLSNELNKLFGKKIEEIEYLRRYSREVISWSSFPEPQRVEYYAQRIRFFLYGGYENYKGLVRDFDDKKILEEIKKRKMIKELLNYSLERKFIADRIREVRIGWQEGNWDDFYKFFRNVKKHAKNLIVRFGNVDFAKRILKDKKKFKEDPRAWLNALQGMETQLSSRHYFENNVLNPTIKELVKIFDDYSEKREKDLNGSLKEFKAYMKNVLDGMEKAPQKKVKEIMKHVNSKEAMIMRGWRKIRSDFEKLEIKLIYHMIKIDNASIEINKKSTQPNVYLKRIDGIEERQEQWRQYFLKIINSIDVMKTGNIPYAEEILSLPPVMGKHDEIIERSDYALEESMISNFSENIPKIIEEAEKASEQLDKIIAFVDEKRLANMVEMGSEKVVPIHRPIPKRPYEGIRGVA